MGRTVTEIPVERTPVMGRTEVVSLTSDHAADGTVERTPIMGRTVSAADGTVERTPFSGAHCVSYRWSGLLLVGRTVSEFPVEQPPVSGAHRGRVLSR